MTSTVAVIHKLHQGRNLSAQFILTMSNQLYRQPFELSWRCNFSV